MNDNTDQTPENPSEIVKPSANRVEVSSDVLTEAVSQLRKLTEIRQRESERQERAIAQMSTAIKRQGILSRWVIFTTLIIMVASLAIAYFMYVSGKNEAKTQNDLGVMNDQLSATSQTIAQETQRQISSLDSVRTEVMTAHEEQTQLSQGIEQELQATRQSHAAVIQKVEEQMGAVRTERDQVKGEVRDMLEEKTAQFTKREIELRAEREAIKEAKIRSKEEQKALIQQTIERLNAMTTSLATDEEAAAPTDAELDKVVEQVDAVEAKINEPDAAAEIVPVVEEAKPAADEVAPVAVEPAPATEQPAAP